MTTAAIQTIAAVVQAVASTVAFVAVGIAARQTSLLRAQTASLMEQTRALVRQIEADHDRSRREIALQLGQRWLDALERPTSLARKLLQRLPPECVRAIYEERAIQIPTEHRALAVACFAGSDLALQPPAPDNPLELSAAHTALVRWLGLRYLNNLENVMSAYRHNIADRDMIREEFQYLFAPEEEDPVLGRFRQFAGGKDSFPAIEEFIHDTRAHLRPDPGRPVLLPRERR